MRGILFAMVALVGACELYTGSEDGARSESADAGVEEAPQAAARPDCGEAPKAPYPVVEYHESRATMSEREWLDMVQFRADAERWMLCARR